MATRNLASVTIMGTATVTVIMDAETQEEGTAGDPLARTLMSGCPGTQQRKTKIVPSFLEGNLPNNYHNLVHVEPQNMGKYYRMSLYHLVPRVKSSNVPVIPCLVITFSFPIIIPCSRISYRFFWSLCFKSWRIYWCFTSLQNFYRYREAGFRSVCTLYFFYLLEAAPSCLLHSVTTPLSSLHIILFVSPCYLICLFVTCYRSGSCLKFKGQQTLYVL